MSVRVIHGRAEQLLTALADDSIPLVVTSPPYDDLRDYGKDAPFDFPVIAGELARVLAPGGVICWNVGDAVVNGGETLTSLRQALHFVDVCGLRMHDTMIYEKSNFSHPDRARYHQLFEYVFVLSKGAPCTFNPIMDKVNAYAGKGTLGTNTVTLKDGSKSDRPRTVIAEFGKRGNVWRGNTRGQERVCGALPHPAMMPLWLARDLILSFSNPGDTVLDPFGGSGTTGLEADRNKRSAILMECHKPYADAARIGIEADNPMFAEVT